MRTLVFFIGVLCCGLIEAQFITRGVSGVKQRILSGSRLVAPQEAIRTQLIGQGGTYVPEQDYISEPLTRRISIAAPALGQYPARIHPTVSQIPSRQYSTPLQTIDSSIYPNLGQFQPTLNRISSLRYPSPLQTIKGSLHPTLSEVPAPQYPTPVPTLRNIPIHPSQYSSLGPAAAILRQAQDVSFDGTYNYGFETENGIAVQANGALKPLGGEETAQVAQGSFTYTSPEGTPITTNWYADENGFHAEGAHLPQSPIVRSR